MIIKSYLIFLFDLKALTGELDIGTLYKNKICMCSYSEWWRDWPDETQQPFGKSKLVLIPAGVLRNPER
jgi:hypothetical protein